MRINNLTECCRCGLLNYCCPFFQLSALPDLIPALAAAEQRAAASLKWRTHEKLLQKYACLPHVISSDQIYYRFLQRMFTIMMTNVSPAAACPLSSWLLWRLPDSAQSHGGAAHGFIPFCRRTTFSQPVERGARPPLCSSSGPLFGQLLPRWSRNRWCFRLPLLMRCWPGECKQVKEEVDRTQGSGQQIISDNSILMNFAFA